MAVLEWCGPDMVEWGLLAWENRDANGERLGSSRNADAEDWGYSCFIGEMGGGEWQRGLTPYEVIRREASSDVIESLDQVFAWFESFRWRMAARPVIEHWLAEQREAA
jgi:hypothetical protein